MILNHLTLTVPDVEKAKNFFETNFNFTCIEQKGNNALVVLNDEKGFVFTLISNAFNKNGNNTYPENFHFGFMLNTPDEVTELYQKLKANGAALPQAPGKIRNSFGFYFHFDNLFIEIGTL